MSKLAQIRAMREANYERQTKPVDKKPRPTADAPFLSTKKPLTNAEHQAKWRAANIETHRERSRNCMLKLRAKRRNHATA